MRKISARFISPIFVQAIILVVFILGVLVPQVFAAVPNAGGNTTVVNPTGEGAISVNEDAPEPEAANIRLIVPTLTDPGGGTPSSIRIISVTGGTMKQGGGGAITLGTSGTILSLSSSRLDLRFKPTSNWNTNASFQYVVVDPHDSSVNSAQSTATISITSVNDTPLLQTTVGTTGSGLAATYYLNQWDLTGSTFERVDSTVNFSNNFGVSGMNNEQFSVRWTGKVESPVTGNVTFSTQSDDGVRLWVNDQLIIDNWTLHGTTTDTASPMALEAGVKYDIRLEFYERGGGEVMILQWAYTGQGTQVVPQSRLFPGTIRPALSFITGSSTPVTIDDGITVSDVDSTTITGGTVAISANYQSGQDELQFTTQNGITGSFSAGTLTLSGTATLAQYQTALRSVKYYNSSGAPNTSTRTVRFRVNDGTDNSNYVFRDIVFSATNSPPVISQGSSVSVTMDEDGSPTAFSTTIGATDVDEHSISWSISSQASHGTATAGDPGNTATINYTPNANYYGTDSFVVQASDGNGGTDTITVNVTIVSDGIENEGAVSASESNDSSNSSSGPSCATQSPTTSPDLFQISTSPSDATLYFSPANPATGYIISYGTTVSANQHSVTFDHTDNSGVVSYVIKSLSSGVPYFFKVQAKNGCATGPWSKVLSQTTTGVLKPVPGLRIAPTATPTPRGEIVVVDKKQSDNPEPTSTKASDQEKPAGHDVEIVVKKQGKPVEGAVVELHSTPRRATTDKDGIARFSGVESGSHTVYMAYDGYKGSEKIQLDGEKKSITVNLTIELHPYNTFILAGVASLIIILAGIIGFLLFALKKKRKKEKED